MKNGKWKCASFFAGVGGIDLGFEKTGRFRTIYANEFDKYPAETYALNFPDTRLQVSDIKDIQPKDVPDMDILCAGFPCQAFSIAGYRKGFEDDKGRGVLFFEALRIIKAKRPRVVFCENVKNLVAHDHGNTFHVICEALESAGYHLKYQVLNAMDYGNIPQNRERIYIVGFLDERDYENFDFPKPIPLKSTISDIINFSSKVDDKYYYSPGKYKGNIYEMLNQAMDDSKAVYQWRRTYVRKNKSGVIPTLTANQGEGGHNVCIIRTKYGIRKMTPRECFNTQGFPSDYKLPNDQSDSRLYKQAGNSVCVSVILRIAQNIAHSLDETDIETRNEGNIWHTARCSKCNALIHIYQSDKIMYCPHCGEVFVPESTTNNKDL